MNADQFIKPLKIIHLAMLLGQLLFIVMSFLLISKFPTFAPYGELSRILIIVITLCLIFSIFLSNFLYRKQISRCKEQKQLVEKLIGYRSSLIIKWAFLEGPSFLSIICYLMTANTSFLLFAVFILVVFTMNNPTRDKLVFDLQLNRNEQELLNSDKPLV